jgi:predicted RNA-binding protein associated with RNAse of E/G family
MARPTPGRAQFHYLESWLLPSLRLRVTVFHFNPGHERNQDFYLDVGEYTRGPDRWEGEDHYLDLVLRSGTGVDVADVDELVAAIHEGLVSRECGERAIRTALATVDALARHDYDLDRWLANVGMVLTWRGA